jgi:periplasmic protein CpxP/Spy
MKTTNKVLVAGSAVLAVVLLSGFAGSGGSCSGRDPERMKQIVTWRMNDKLEDLGATEQQKQAFNALKDSLFEQGQGLTQGQQAVRQEMLAQWESVNPDSRRVHQLVDERFESFRTFAHRVADAALEAHRILTPEQRQAVAAEVRERSGNR